MSIHLIDAYIKDVCCKDNETPRAYRGKLGRFAEWFGSRDIQSLMEQDLNNFRVFLQTKKLKCKGKCQVKEKLSPHTVHTVLVTVRGWLRWCFKRGHLARDVTDGWRIPSAPKPDPKPVSNETVERMLAAIPLVGPCWEQARNLAILYLLRDTGGRVGALVAAELEHIDWPQEVIWSQSKGKPYPLFMTRPSRSALLAWLKVRHEARPADYKVFTGAKNTGLTRSGMYHVLERLADAGGVEGRHNAHAFRHAFARDSLQAGADLSQVSQLMVHSTITVTADYYTRWNVDELREVHKKTSPGRALPLPG